MDDILYDTSKDGRLPFLNVLVTAQESGFETTVYIKKTNKGLCLNGNSEGTKRCTDSTINAYVRRALTHCSTWKNVHEELERVTQVLVNNGYRSTDITAAIKREISEWHNRTTNSTAEGNNINLYYKSHMSPTYKIEESTIKIIVKNNVTPTDPSKKINLDIYYRSMKTSQLLIRNKDMPKPRHLQQSHVIYEHTCSIEGCGPQKYMTRTTLSRRLTCHLQNGAIKQHYTTKHKAEVTRNMLKENTRIIDKESDPRRLLYLEALYIENASPEMNKQQQDIQVLSTIKRSIRENGRIQHQVPSASPASQ
ncbi:hypothetical protein E2C01_053902 [Portunus trituberculatus]|uniref:Helix-turn-helix domain-containing protein n=1 Tax=Portunus trituberculatus TaxID=210409 RepID=A0A5B7GTJ5_PORTR|nr:hypothetical protein [Portunus trituberculatus]